MQITLTIPGSIRSKKNSKRVFGCGKFKKVLPSKAYLAWEDSARVEAMIQTTGLRGLRIRKGGILIPEGIQCCVKALCFCKGVLPDLSGALESVGDAFRGILWKDDKQIVSWDGSRVYRDTKNPCTKISILWNTCHDEEKKL